MYSLLQKLPVGVKDFIKRILAALYKYIVYLIPIDKRIITFCALNGRNYSGSSRVVYEYMVNHGLDKSFRIFWFIRKGREPDSIPGNAEIVPYRSVAYFYYMSRAAIWVCDSRQPDFLIKKKNQRYIQIWHGTPYKRLGLDIENLHMAGSYVGKDKYQDGIRSNSRQWDYLVTQNAFSTPIFQRCFDFHKKMLLTGYPRNDVLFHKNNPEDIIELKKKLGLPLDKKIILYAPTYRDNQYNERRAYTFKAEIDYDLMREKLSDEYVMIVKYHYFISDKYDLSKYKGFVYQMDTDADISFLYLVSDLLITDYSSVMFDYSLLHRPMYFYCYDLEDYSTELRGCYFDLVEEAPGPISKTTEELVEDILMPAGEFDEKFGKKQQEFYQKYHTYENGTAAEQIVNLIMAIHNGEEPE